MKKNTIVLKGLLIANLVLLCCCIFLILVMLMRTAPRENEIDYGEVLEVGRIYKESVLQENITAETLPLEYFLEQYKKEYNEETGLEVYGEKKFYGVSQAKEDGCVVIWGDEVLNEALWLTFLEAANNGLECHVRVVVYPDYIHTYVGNVENIWPNAVLDVSFQNSKYMVKEVREVQEYIDNATYKWMMENPELSEHSIILGNTIFVNNRLVTVHYLQKKVMLERGYVYLKSQPIGGTTNGQIYYIFSNQEDIIVNDIEVAKEQLKKDQINGNATAQYGGVLDCATIVMPNKNRAFRIHNLLKLETIPIELLEQSITQDSLEGCILVEEGTIVSGMSLWIDYTERCRRNEESKIRIVVKEDGNVVAMDLVYKDEIYTLRRAEKTGEQEELYKTFQSFVVQNNDNQVEIVYVLTNDPQLNQETWNTKMKDGYVVGVTTKVFHQVIETTNKKTEF